MTNPEVREYNLKLIADCAKTTPGISISSQHFAERDFCVCPRCVEQWRQSGLNWVDWRAKTVTEFLKEVRDVVKNKPLFVNCLPDPLLGKARFGYDFEAMAEYADYFVIPMFSKAYPTPWYWETIARGYKSFLKKPSVRELLRPRSKRNLGNSCAYKADNDCCNTRSKNRHRRHHIPSRKSRLDPRVPKESRRRQRMAKRARRLRRRRSPRTLQPMGKALLNFPNPFLTKILIFSIFLIGLTFLM